MESKNFSRRVWNTMTWPHIFVRYRWLGSTRTQFDEELPAWKEAKVEWICQTLFLWGRLTAVFPPRSGSGKGKDDEEFSLITTCHCWTLGSLCIVFFFLTFLCPYTAVIQIIWHVNFEGVEFASIGFRVYVYRRVYALHPTGTLWSAQGFLMMVRLLCEASAADLYASWLEKNLQIFFFSFRTSHMMPNCTCEKKMARREKDPAENRPVNRKVHASVDVHSVCLLW